ncbi:MAG: FCD domain-containing protein [Kiritimatiellae bacterium]|nr:FCD domain-containing protein [Kiritimatiellia bacterium]
MKANEDRSAHVAGLMQEALEAGLLGAEWASGKGCRWLAEAYNGIGPEFAGAALRGRATARLRIFEPAAMIHDGRTHASDGSRQGFVQANVEFHMNCLLLADRAYPWWNWKRYRARLVADALYDCVSSPAGWHAWQQAHERFVQRRNKENCK